MKWISLGLLVIGSLVLTAQVRTPTPEDRVRAMQREMTLLDRPLGEKPPAAIPRMGLKYTADTVKVEGNTVHLVGHVRIAGAGFVLTADRAEYQRDSGSIDPHGDVHVQVVPIDTRK